MIELLITDHPTYNKIAIKDSITYWVWYNGDSEPTEYSRKNKGSFCGFEKYALIIERKAKLAKLLSQ